MLININPAAAWHLKEQKQGTMEALVYEPLFFKQRSSGKIMHTGMRVVSQDNKGVLLDMAVLMVDGETGKIVLKHQPLEPITAPIDE